MAGISLEEKVLTHVSNYKLTLPVVLQRTFFEEVGNGDENEINNALARLTSGKTPKLERHAFPLEDVLGGEEMKRDEYYILSGTKPKVDYDLACLWYCTMGKERRHRLTNSEVISLFGESNAPHHHIRLCISDGDGGPYITRLYPSSSSVKGTLAYLKKKHIAESMKQLPSWVADGDYGLTILVESYSKRESIESQLKRKTGGESGGRKRSLHEQVRIAVETVPNSRNISRWIRGLRHD